MSRPPSLAQPQARSRHHFQVATSWTTKPGRDVNSMSRPPCCPNKTAQVATSKWGRDTSFHRVGRTMSRHQIGVATPLRPIQVTTLKPGRDPPGGYPMSRHQFYVATSFLPTVGFLGRNAQLQVATSHIATHVATSK